MESLPRNITYWYRGEGNSSLVICLKEKGQIIRLKKCLPDNLTSTKQVEDETKEDVEAQIDFCTKVMQPLLGASFVHCPEKISLSAKDVSLINKIANGHRPDHRLRKILPHSPMYALVLPDYCSLPLEYSKYMKTGPVVAVEIKLKQGFLPSSDMHPAQEEIESSVCHFCMKQYTKKKSGIIQHISGYCPIDLFSGCVHRMRHALMELFKSPQNNFRLFKDQQLITSEREELDLPRFLNDFIQSRNFGIEENFCHLLIEILTRPFPVNESIPVIIIRKPSKDQCLGKQPIEPCTPFNCHQCHELPEGCVLERILRVQQFDTLGVATIYNIYKRWRAKYYGDSVLLAMKHWNPCLVPEEIGGDQRPYESEMEFYRRKIWEFLIALTAKDCSVMIVLQKLREPCAHVPEQYVVRDLQDQPYLFSIAIADLDSKEPAKIQKVYFKECEHVVAYNVSRFEGFTSMFK